MCHRSATDRDYMQKSNMLTLTLLLLLNLCKYMSSSQHVTCSDLSVPTHITISLYYS